MLLHLPTHLSVFGEAALKLPSHISVFGDSCNTQQQQQQQQQGLVQPPALAALGMPAENMLSQQLSVHGARRLGRAEGGSPLAGHEGELHMYTGGCQWTVAQSQLCRDQGNVALASLAHSCSLGRSLNPASSACPFLRPHAWDRQQKRLWSMSS